VNGTGLIIVSSFTAALCPCRANGPDGLRGVCHRKATRQSDLFRLFLLALQLYHPIPIGRRLAIVLGDVDHQKIFHLIFGRNTVQ
jgi:hypothetical protein